MKKFLGSYICLCVVMVLACTAVLAQDPYAFPAGETPGETHAPGMDIAAGNANDISEDHQLDTFDLDVAPPGSSNTGSEAHQIRNGSEEERYPYPAEDQKIEASANEKISLDLRSINLIELFKVLSIKTKQNIIPSKSIKGRISIYLNNITFEDALEVILVSNGLASEKSGEAILILTAAEYKILYGKDYNERRKVKILQLHYAAPSVVFKALEGIKSNIGKIVIDAASGTVVLIDTPEAIERMQKMIIQIDSPLDTRAIEIQYGDAEEIKSKLDSIITPDVGVVTVDARTNSLVVSDLPGKMESIMKCVKLFDEETKEVFIEAEIMEIELRDRFQYGIDWQKIMNNPSFYGMALTGHFPASAALANYQKVTFGNLSQDNFTATINMLNTLGNTKVLSRPRLAVINNAEASIMVGRKEVYSTTSMSQGSESTITSEAVEFIDVGVKLNVTPTINSEGFITMKIRPEVSTVVDTYTTPNDNEIPVIQTSESSTTVKIADGEMIMIAGLMQNEKTRSREGIPFLSKIPILGAIFGSSDNDAHRKELIIFIKATIIDGDRQRRWDKEAIRKFPEDSRPESEIEEPELQQWRLKDEKPLNFISRNK